MRPTPKYSNRPVRTRKNSSGPRFDRSTSWEPCDWRRCEHFSTTTRRADWPGVTSSGELPALPFADRSFDLALSSHFLFLYTEQFDESFHRASVVEMCRVADEVRVFPLLALGAVRSRHVDPIGDDLRRRGFQVTIETVPYEFQKGGNQMMRIRRAGINSGRGSRC